MAGILSFHTDAEKEPWVIIELKDEQPVIGLEILNRTDTHWSRVKNLHVWLSSDGTHWEQVFNSAKAERRWWVDLKQPKHARYVKIGTVNAKLQFFHLKGVKVYAK
jgi:hypothetical protein